MIPKGIIKEPVSLGNGYYKFIIKLTEKEYEYNESVIDEIKDYLVKHGYRVEGVSRLLNYKGTFKNTFCFLTFKDKVSSLD